MTTKGRHKVNQMRHEKGKMYYRKLINETEKKNKNQPVDYYREDSPQFKIYKPNKGGK